MNGAWADLRSSATSLEREVDDLLRQMNAFLPSGGLGHLNAGQIAAQRQEFDKVNAELETRISRLMAINEQMAAYLSDYERGGIYDQSMRSLYFRHREMFRSYCSEFSRAQGNISAELKRADLLAGASQQKETSALNNRARSSDYLLRENDRINSCERLLDEQISIAMGVKDGLHSQRVTMTEINKRLHQLSKKYPALGSLMQKIRMKKRKDTIILAAVILSCLIFFFFMIVH